MTNAPKVRFHNDGPFEINEDMAGLVPMALSDEQTALMEDIEINGQRDPIVLWRGEMVDGRCRSKALTMLGMNYIYKELDDELSEDDVAAYVKSVNTRRNLTLTQKVVSAYKKYDKNRSANTIPGIARSWSIGSAILNNMLFIAKHKPDFVDPLFNGLSVEIVNKDGIEVSSNKITAIWAFVKREQEIVVNREVDHAWKADGAIKTQVGKEWFYDFIKEHGIQNIEVMKALADAANFRYKLNKKDEK